MSRRGSAIGRQSCNRFYLFYFGRLRIVHRYTSILSFTPHSRHVHKSPTKEYSRHSHILLLRCSFEDPRSLPIHAILCNYVEDFISCAPILFRNVPLRVREFSHASVSLRRFSLSRSNHTFIERLFLKGINQTSSTIRLKRAEFCLSMSHLNIRKSPGRKHCGRFFEKRHRYHARTHTYTHIQHTPLHTPKRVQRRSGGRAAPG